jgi:hypothetical protein
LRAFVYFLGSIWGPFGVHLGMPKWPKTLVVSGPSIGGVVCLSKCRVDVVDCSSESAELSVYGPRIGFMGHFDPFRCKTYSCTATGSFFSTDTSMQLLNFCSACQNKFLNI